MLELETDCWDVHHAIANDRKDFVLLDVRGEQTFTKGHTAGSVNLTHTRINEDTLSKYTHDTLFVVYCAGPHCSATDKAAVKLARLHRPVKKMIDGVTGWLDDGFTLTEN